MMKFSKGLVAVGAALALLGGGCAGGGASAANQTSPEAVVEAFLQAVQDKDKAEAQAYVHAESELGQNFDEVWEEIGEDLTLKSFTILGVEEDKVEVELELTEGGESETDTETIEAVERDGKWWVLEI